ncbi:hypothetical protein DL764_009368 [Monosporascus ibericus]|uniref:DUF7918 domain-containing protein n=1 Tax=Monosporascus ibericus TaxID=155417 RepID=A0A4Q4SY93_9PEZI|nr:hypothetical protein DL764_009368 [Monosporascus ibericus]
MAVLDEVRGIFVSIQAAGKDLKELNAQQHPGQGKSCPTLTAYVEAVDNAEFAIRLAVDQTYAWGLPHHGLAFFIKVDGKRVRGRVLEGPHIISCGPWVKTVRGQCDPHGGSGRWLEKRFKFREVSIVEEETGVSATDELGVVQVKVCRVKVGQPLGEPPLYGAGEPDSFELSENSLKGKAISHVTSYSEARDFRFPSARHLERYPGDTGPIAIFQFRYQSREALKQKFVALRTPNPPSTVGGLPKAERHHMDGLFASTQATIETVAELHTKCESDESPDFTWEG